VSLWVTTAGAVEDCMVAADAGSALNASIAAEAAIREIRRNMEILYLRVD
jgi:hypothetical protein